jgi:hypothetical protein
MASSPRRCLSAPSAMSGSKNSRSYAQRSPTARTRSYGKRSASKSSMSKGVCPGYQEYWLKNRQPEYWLEKPSTMKRGLSTED